MFNRNSEPFAGCALTANANILHFPVSRISWALLGFRRKVWGRIPMHPRELESQKSSSASHHILSIHRFRCPIHISACTVLVSHGTATSRTRHSLDPRSWFSVWHGRPRRPDLRGHVGCTIQWNLLWTNGFGSWSYHLGFTSGTPQCRLQIFHCIYWHIFCHALGTPHEPDRANRWSNVLERLSFCLVFVHGQEVFWCLFFPNVSPSGREQP